MHRMNAEPDKAIADHSAAITFDPDLSVAYFGRGLAYMDKHDFDKAIENYTEAIHLNPKHVQAFYSRSQAYLYRGECDKAIRDCNAAIRIDPKCVGAYNTVLRHSSAEASMTQPFPTCPKLSGSIQEGRLPLEPRQGLCRHKGVRQSHHRFYGDDSPQPQFGEAYYHRGLAYEKLGDKSKANESLPGEETWLRREIGVA